MAYTHYPQYTVNLYTFWENFYITLWAGMTQIIPCRIVTCPKIPICKVWSVYYTQCPGFSKRFQSLSPSTIYDITLQMKLALNATYDTRSPKMQTLLHCGGVMACQCASSTEGSRHSATFSSATVKWHWNFWRYNHQYTYKYYDEILHIIP